MQNRLFHLGLLVALSYAPAAFAGEKMDATYKFYWKGILVSQADTSATLSPEKYDLEIDFRMRGIAKLFANGRSSVRVKGRLDDTGPVPALYETDGRWDGDDYAQTMTFDSDGALVEQKLDWPEKWLEESKREPVPDDMQVGPDPASLVVKLISMPLENVTSNEGVVVRSFDGDSVFDWGITCLPDPVELDESGKSPFSGEAYECGFDGELVAGKRILTEKQKKKAEKRRKKEEKRRAKGKVEEEKPPKMWVQSFMDGAYILPVRAEVSTGMGRVVMYLSSLEVSESMPATVERANALTVDTAEIMDADSSR